MLNFKNNLLNFLTVLGWRVLKAQQCVFWEFNLISIRFSLIFSKDFERVSWRENPKWEITSIIFQKLIMISYIWRRAKLGLDWFPWQLHSCEDECSSLVLLVVFGCCISEFSNCIVFLVNFLVGYCLIGVIRHCNWEKLVIQLLCCCVSIQICSDVLHLHCECASCVVRSCTKG